MSMAYFCDGPGCGMRGEPRGKACALPAGWVCVAGVGVVLILCLKCEMARRAARGKT
jgi:hypothetical protein